MEDARCGAFLLAPTATNPAGHCARVLTGIYEGLPSASLWQRCWLPGSGPPPHFQTAPPLEPPPLKPNKSVNSIVMKMKSEDLVLKVCI